MFRLTWLSVLALLLGVGSLYAIVDDEQPRVELGFEAEDAGAIVEPMVIGVPADAAAQGGAEPSAPSGGKFVWVPGPPLTGDPTDHTGYMEFEVDMPKAGVYAIWGYVTAWDGNSDSFWVKWAGDPDEDPQVSQNTHFRWNVETGEDWHWDRINQWLNAGTFEREWEVPAGLSTLRIGTRETAAMLDAIYITENLSEDVDEVSPKLPPDIVAVESQGKLAVSWASLRSTR